MLDAGIWRWTVWVAGSTGVTLTGAGACCALTCLAATTGVESASRCLPTTWALLPLTLLTSWTSAATPGDRGDLVCARGFGLFSWRRGNCGYFLGS